MTISGKSKTLKHYADVHDTIEAIQRIVQENYSQMSQLAESLQAGSCRSTFSNIWEYVRHNIRYENDEKGKEQLRTPQRTLHDKKGDCDDMSILISCILNNLGYEHELWVTAYKTKTGWQHIYPVAYSSGGQRYVIDCVPEIPFFNYEAKPIRNKIIIDMKLEELGRAIPAEMIHEMTQPFDINTLDGIQSSEEDLVKIQSLLGNIAIVDEEDDFDTVISGSDLQRNIILRQLTEAQKALQEEVSQPTDMSQINDNGKELRMISSIIDSFHDEHERDKAIREAMSQDSLYKNFYKAVEYGLQEADSGLMGEEEDDMYYLKVMDEYGELEDLISDSFSESDYQSMHGTLSGGLFKKLRDKIKRGVKKFKEKHPKLAKVGHALKKFSPATFTLRRSMEPFLRANVFQMAEKLALGYASEEQAKKMGYSNTEWKEFVSAKDKAEQRWHAIGGKKDYFKKMVMKGRGAKQAGLRGELGVAPAIIAAVTKIFGGIINLFKKLKLRKKKRQEEEAGEDYGEGGASAASDYNEDEGSETENLETDPKTGLSVETVTDENGKEKKLYRDKEGNEISKMKYFMLKNKKMIIIVAIVLTIGIVALVIWKMRQRAMQGLGEVGLSRRQQNYIRRQGLNNRAYASLVREEIKKDKKPYNSSNRKAYYKKVFRDAFNKPISQKQVQAAQNYNQMYSEVRKLAKAKGGGSKAWKQAWQEVKKKR